MALTARGEETAAPTSSPTRWRYALEGDVFVGFGRVIAPTLDHSSELASTNGGFGGAVGLAFRSPYFVSPFVEVGYWSLYRAESNVALGSGLGTALVQSRLSSFSVLFGPAIDVWRFRARAAIGAYGLSVSSRVAGDRVSASEVDMGYALALSGFIVRTPRVQVGLEARLLFNVEGSITLFSAGPTFTGDLLRW